MRFNDIAAALESRENCSLLIKTDFDPIFVDNLYVYIASSRKIVSTLDFSKKKEVDRAEILKRDLAYILNNWSSIEIHALGWRPTKRKGR